MRLRPSIGKSIVRNCATPLGSILAMTPTPQCWCRMRAPTRRFMSLALAVSSPTSRQPWSNQYSVTFANGFAMA